MNRISQTEIEKWFTKGYVGPFSAYSGGEMEKKAAYLKKAIIGIPAPGHLKDDPYYCRHLDNKMVLELCHNSIIVNAIEALFGSNLILYMSEFINKQAGGKEIKWHQDVGDILNPMISLTVWMAIDKVTVENGCLRIIPSKHGLHLPHNWDSNNSVIDAQFINESLAEDIELQAGQFIIFKDTTIHSSRKNNSTKDRLGFTFRVTIPITRIKKDGRFFPDYHIVMLKGEDTLGFNAAYY